MGNHKSVSASEAIAAIKPGSTIIIGESCGEPQTLLEALIEDKERLKGSRLIECRRITGSRYAELFDYLHIITLHTMADLRDAISAGKADFLPVKLSELYTLFQPGSPVTIDVALVQVSPADSQGNCSLGVSVGYEREAALGAKMVIAEVNQQMPRTCGNSLLPLDTFDYVVETSRPLLEYPSPQFGEAEIAVAKNVMQLVDDGSVLSLGIGAQPEAIVSSLSGKRDLGIHCGMITDGIIPPIKEKIITNARKNVHKGKTVTGIVTGTEKLFQFVRENPEIEAHPYSYTHNINTISQMDNFICINSAVDVDLTGQINAESIGSTQISTIGGQADFMRGAALSKGGKSIIALPSATKNEKYSRIVAQLKEGSIVSTPRYDIHYVVTEYGIAELWGKTLAQRRDALIAIAHPKFRDELYRAVKTS